MQSAQHCVHQCMCIWCLIRASSGRSPKQHGGAGGMACVLVQADARRIFQMYNMPGGSEDG